MICKTRVAFNYDFFSYWPTVLTFHSKLFRKKLPRLSMSYEVDKKLNKCSALVFDTFQQCRIILYLLIFLSKCQQSCRQKVNKCFVLSSVCSLTLKWTISSVIDLVISLYLVWVRLKTNLSKSFSGFSSMVSYLSHKNTFTIMFNTWKM